MKHCSECNFTFTDDEQVCDFDGTQLTAVPEPGPHSPGPASPLRRLLQSQGLIVIVALVGLMASALLIGYYDSLDQPSADAALSVNIPPASSETLPGPTEQVGQTKVTTIDTQRRVRADGKPELVSIIKWPKGVARSRSTRSHPRRTSTRLPATSRSPVAKRYREKIGSRSLAGIRNRYSAERRAHLYRNAVATAKRPSRTNAVVVAHHTKDSKVVAVLKTTGRILKWPFQF